MVLVQSLPVLVLLGEDTAVVVHCMLRVGVLAVVGVVVVAVVLPQGAQVQRGKAMMVTIPTDKAAGVQVPQGQSMVG
jgi:hypothetical protein